MTNKIAKAPAWSTSQIALITRTVAKGATPDELTLFSHICRKAGLDPFLKEIFFVKHNESNMYVMTSRDGFLAIAQRTGEFKGIQSGAVYEKDSIEIDASTMTVKHIISTFADRGKLQGAWCKVYREGCEPYIATVQFAQYFRTTPIWQKFPDAMIVKVAESIALKKMFAVSGLVSTEEMGFEPEKAEVLPDFNTLFAKIEISKDPNKFATEMLENPPFPLSDEQKNKLNLLCKKEIAQIEK